VLELENGVPFVPAGYLALGYTEYSVVTIGAAGGHGSDLIWNDSPYDGIGYLAIRTGGAGGGGGIQIVDGLLSALPASCPVVVGQAGADASTITTYANEPSAQFGANGGYSSFNGALCRASGGKGGAHGEQWVGGDGGYGGTLVAGNGGKGDSYATPRPTDAERQGDWNPTLKIGTGGGGGRGAAAYLPNHTSGVDNIGQASDGGPGAFRNVVDATYAEYQALGGVVSNMSYAGRVMPLIPGPGGGAIANPLTLKSTPYGSKAVSSVPDGAVIIRLT
jgi:hypothetical protein